jgi:thiamine phosphate synthase YjbQ (UPF0047 family)
MGGNKKMVTMTEQIKKLKLYDRLKNGYQFVHLRHGDYAIFNEKKYEQDYKKMLKGLMTKREFNNNSYTIYESYDPYMVKKEIVKRGLNK